VSVFSAWLLGILGLQVAMLVAGPGRAVRIVAALGVLTALVLLVAAREPTRIPLASRAAAPGRPLLLAGLPFVLAVVAWWAPVRVAFWTLDGRAMLAVAWTVALACLPAPTGAGPEAGQEPSRARRPWLRSGLLVAWVAMLWVTLLWDVGVGHLVFARDRPAGQPCWGNALASTFQTWDSQPAAEHLYLPWRTPADFASRTAYVHHSQPYLLLLYGFVELVQTATGLTLSQATATVPFLYMAAAVAALWLLLARWPGPTDLARPVARLSLVLGLGFLMTQWRFWSDLFRFNLDNPHHLLAPLFVGVWCALRTNAREASVLAAAAVVAALSPIYVPILLAAVAVEGAGPGALLPRTAERRRLLVRAAAMCIPIALLVRGLPSALVAWKGYQAFGSTFLFRSGLDGDPTYLRNLVQAVVAPCGLTMGCCGDRSLADLLVPAFVPLALTAGWMLRRHPLSRARVLAAAAVLVSPYLYSVVLVPQSVSIHPYLYDHLLATPVVILGVWCLLHSAVQRQLRGGTLLLFGLVMVGLVMANLVALAQLAARWP
jgi:hypothetical protein